MRNADRLKAILEERERALVESCRKHLEDAVCEDAHVSVCSALIAELDLLVQNHTRLEALRYVQRDLGLDPFRP